MKKNVRDINFFELVSCICNCVLILEIGKIVKACTKPPSSNEVVTAHIWLIPPRKMGQDQKPGKLLKTVIH